LGNAPVCCIQTVRSRNNGHDDGGGTGDGGESRYSVIICTRVIELITRIQPPKIVFGYEFEKLSGFPGTLHCIVGEVVPYPTTQR
jgi:hypothetical protein